MFQRRFSLIVIQPPDPLEANRFQAALTRRFLQPVLPELEALFLRMRAETDRALAEGAAPRRDKPYPYGYCLEITRDVVTNLRDRGAAARCAGARALTAFFKHGGEGTLVWGVLRGRYFQNAIKLGSLYVDVANDSVDPAKPKVEILPMEASGLELVRDIVHFAEIAERYWGVRSYANTALPALAPLFPLLVVDPQQRVLLQSKAGYMMRLLAADGFRMSERWLAEGPQPPRDVVEALRGRCPPDLLTASPKASASAAAEACRALRESGTPIDAKWIDHMVGLFDRAPQIRILRVAPEPVALNDVARTNARFQMGNRAVAA